MLQQRTLKTLTRAVGVGLHSGQRVELTLRPAPADTGVVFRRVDLPEPVDIVVSAAAVSDTRLASTLSNGSVKVHTVEHLMSACAGLGVDNLYVDITAEEVPILDGSAASFVFLLQSAGIVLQNAPRRFIQLLAPVEVREGQGAAEKWARLEPFHGYRLSFEIDFDHLKIFSSHTCHTIMSRLFHTWEGTGRVSGWSAGTWVTVHTLHTVSSTKTFESVALDNTSETAALTDAYHVNASNFAELIDGENLTNLNAFQTGGIFLTNFANEFLWF